MFEPVKVPLFMILCLLVCAGFRRLTAAAGPTPSPLAWTCLAAENRDACRVCAWYSPFVWLGRPRARPGRGIPWRSNPAISLDSRDKAAPARFDVVRRCSPPRTGLDSNSLRSQDDSSTVYAQRRARGVGVGCELDHRPLCCHIFETAS